MPKTRDSFGSTTAEKANKHDDLMPLIESMYHEFQELSKKKPDGVLNKRKVEIVNRLLRDIHGILAGESTKHISRLSRRRRPAAEQRRRPNTKPDSRYDEDIQKEALRPQPDEQ